MQISRARLTPSGRVFSNSAPRSSASRYRHASFVAGFGPSISSLAKRKRSSVVVTMFSISELALASRIGIVLMRIAGFGTRSAAAFNSARAARARMHALSTTAVSSSALGGSAGRSSKGRLGLSARTVATTHYMSTKLRFVDISYRYVDNIDKSGQYVDQRVVCRHVETIYRHYRQNSSFSANCSNRGGPAERMRPKLGEFRSATGRP